MRINLDEQVILETDRTGNELLRLEIACEGKLIRVRFPTYGNYDGFSKEVAALCLILSGFAENLKIPTEWETLSEKSEYALWAALTAAAVRQKKASRLIERIFVKYLRPEIDQVKLRLDSPRRNQRRKIQWMRENMGVDLLVRMFAAILAVDQWVKKNMLFILTKIHRMAIQQPFSAISTKNGDTPPAKSEVSPSYTSVSF